MWALKMTEMVVLVPGVGFGGLELRLLARHLRRAGFWVEIFRHASGRPTLADSAEALHEWVFSQRSDAVHFVAHSLGGLIVFQMFAAHPKQRPGRIVTLGIPLQGCLAARRVLAVPGGRWLLSKSVAAVFSDELPPLPPKREIGSIAGRLNFIFGWLLALRQPNDTLICVEESRHPKIAAHVVLPVSHSGLLLSGRVGRCVVNFLRTGAFFSTRSELANSTAA